MVSIRILERVGGECTTSLSEEKKEVCMGPSKKRKKISERNPAQVKRLERRFDAGEEKQDGEEWSLERWRDNLEETKEGRARIDWSWKTGRHRGAWKAMRVQYCTWRKRKRDKEGAVGGWFSSLCTGGKSKPCVEQKNLECRRRKKRTKVCICLNQTWQQCTQLTSSWLYNILPFSSMSHLMLQRPESWTDACISTGLIRIIPHTNDKVRVSQPRPSDFCLGAQMIPCIPVITRPFARQPMKASLTGRLKTPGGRHHPAAHSLCLPGDAVRWMFVAKRRQWCLWQGFAEWHGREDGELC